MNKPIKFFALFISLSLFVASLSFNTLAAENTQEAEQTPYLYGVYYNENNDEVDGNTLTSGEYTVDIMLEGVEGVSVLQYTAEYDPSVVTSISTDAVITDSKSDISLGGIKTADAENGKKRVAVALASTASSYTSLDAQAATPITEMSVTVDAGDGTVDFEDYFDFVTDPDLTFLEDDYNNGIEDVYALDMSVPTAYNKTLMTADITPENELEPDDTITVSGIVVWATATDGTAQGTIGTDVFGARGIKFQIKDSNDVWTDVTDENGNIIETASDAAENYGNFSVNVPTGTTEIRVVAYDFDANEERGLPRIVTLSGTQDVDEAYIPYIICDYNGSGSMNVEDSGIFNSAYNGRDIFADLNNSGSWNVEDKGLYSAFKNKAISYGTALNLDS